MSPQSHLEKAFELQLDERGVITPLIEYRFHATRKWRFDFAWPNRKVAVEVEGGTWNGGRHTTGAGFRADCEKYNAAAVDGWLVLRFTADSIKDGSGVVIVDSLLQSLNKGDL